MDNANTIQGQAGRLRLSRLGKMFAKGYLRANRQIRVMSALPFKAEHYWSWPLTAITGHWPLLQLRGSLMRAEINSTAYDPSGDLCLYVIGLLAPAVLAGSLQE